MVNDLVSFDILIYDTGAARAIPALRRVRIIYVIPN